jgi:hypothetical protein
MDALTTLEDVVNSVLNRLNEDESQYIRYYQIAIEQLVDFNLFQIRGFNVVELSMDDNHRVMMPSDCIRILAIGVPYLGRLWQFTKDDSIYRGQSIKNGILSSDTDMADGNVVEQSIDNGYAVRGGVNEFYYTIDYNQRKILISGTPKTPITLHYVSSGISEEGVTYLPLEAKNALVACIIHKAKLYDRSVNLGEKAIYEKEYAKQSRKLKILQTTLSIDTLHDAWLKTIRQTAKR